MEHFPHSADLTYDAVGITSAALRSDAHPTDHLAPPGFRTLRVDMPLGAATYERAVAALFSWRMHGALPLFHVAPTTEEAAPGVRVTVQLGPLRAPCEVVWAVREENHAGFAYGTLPGHPESGEEAFVLRRLPDDQVTFTVLAVSRPATWYIRAAGPAARWGQHLIAHRYGRALTRLAR